MDGPRFGARAFLAAVAGLALSGCGGSPSSPSSSSTGGGGSSQTIAPVISAPAGSSFCTQFTVVSAQLSNLGKTIFSVSPGATPSVTAFQQFFATITAAIDALDGSAPSEIASSVHTLRNAYDQLNTQAQSATSVQQAESLFSSLDTQPLKDADAAITSYLHNTCGIGPSPRITPAP